MTRHRPGGSMLARAAARVFGTGGQAPVPLPGAALPYDGGLAGRAAFFQSECGRCGRLAATGLPCPACGWLFGTLTPDQYLARRWICEAADPLDPVMHDSGPGDAPSRRCRCGQPLITVRGRWGVFPAAWDGQPVGTWTDDYRDPADAEQAASREPGWAVGWIPAEILQRGEA